jgi:hypothetical protein
LNTFLWSAALVNTRVDESFFWWKMWSNFELHKKSCKLTKNFQILAQNTMFTDFSYLFRAIVLAAFIAGTLDITAACMQAYLVRGTTPVQVLQFVASGVWGQNAFTGGLQSVFAGLGLHYLIAYLWATVFFFAYPYVQHYLPKAAQNLVLMAVVYGAFVWSVMTFLVLPMSNISQGPFNPLQASIGAGILMICIGLPIAWCAQRFYAQQEAEQKVEQSA